MLVSFRKWLGMNEEVSFFFQDHLMGTGGSYSIYKKNKKTKKTPSISLREPPKGTNKVVSIYLLDQTGE